MLSIPLYSVSHGVGNVIGSSVNTTSTDDEVWYSTNVLEQIARQHELVMHDVPRDDNCLFSSVAYQLQNMGHDVSASVLKVCPH